MREVFKDFETEFIETGTIKEEPEHEKASFWRCFIAFFFWFFGLISYCIRKKNHPYEAKKTLQWANRGLWISVLISAAFGAYCGYLLATKEPDIVRNIYFAIRSQNFAEAINTAEQIDLLGLFLQ